MLRRYDEPIEVRRAGEDPIAFIWRGRLYQVRAVLDRWQERTAWWRDALDRSPEAGGSGCRTGHQVWRVEASAGRADGVGVYDLQTGVAPSGDWLLLGAVD